MATLITKKRKNIPLDAHCLSPLVKAS